MPIPRQIVPIVRPWLSASAARFYGIRYMKEPKQKKRGRPKAVEEPMRQVAIRFPEEMLAEIDNIIAGRMDRPDRSAIIRQAVAEWFAARKAPKK